MCCDVITMRLVLLPAFKRGPAWCWMRTFFRLGVRVSFESFAVKWYAAHRQNNRRQYTNGTRNTQSSEFLTNLKKELAIDYTSIYYQSIAWGITSSWVVSIDDLSFPIHYTQHTIDRELLSLLERQQNPPPPTTRYRPFNRLRPPQHSTASNNGPEPAPCMPCQLCVCVHTITYRPLSLSVSSCRDCRPEGSETIREHTPIPPFRLCPSAFLRSGHPCILGRIRVSF